MTMLNVVGVRLVASASNVFAIGKLLPLTIFIVIGLFFLDPARFSLTVAPGYRAFSQSVLLLVYAFTGFEMAVIPAGEARNPSRNLPAALMTGMATVVVFYVLIQVVCIGTLPHLSTSQRPLADAATHFLGTWGALMITAGIVISLAGNLNVLVLSASRVVFAMAERGDLPSTLATIHQRYRTPAMAVLSTTAIMLVLTLSGSFMALVTVSTVSRLGSYLVTCSALPVLRRRPGAPKAAFMLPAGVPLAIVSYDAGRLVTIQQHVTRGARHINCGVSRADRLCFESPIVRDAPPRLDLLASILKSPGKGIAGRLCAEPHYVKPFHVKPFHQIYTIALIYLGRNFGKLVERGIYVRSTLQEFDRFASFYPACLRAGLCLAKRHRHRFVRRGHSRRKGGRGIAGYWPTTRDVDRSHWDLSDPRTGDWHLHRHYRQGRVQVHRLWKGRDFRRPATDHRRPPGGRRRHRVGRGGRGIGNAEADLSRSRCPGGTATDSRYPDQRAELGHPDGVGPRGG